MKPEPIIEIYVGENRPVVTKWLAVAGAVAFGLAVVWMVYIVCMDLLPYALRML